FYIILFFSTSINNSTYFFFFSSRRRHTRSKRDWSSDVCSSDLIAISRPWLVKKKETGNGDSAVIDIIDLDKVKKMKNQLSKMARSNRMALTEAAVRGRAEFAHELERVLANTDVEEEINLDGLDLEEEKK